VSGIWAQSSKLEKPIWIRRANNSKRFLTSMAAAAFFFQVLLSGSDGGGSDLVRRSIVVEVIPTMVPGTVATGEKEKTERAGAEAVALQAASEIIRGELESATDPGNSIAQIGSLPDEIGQQPPTLQRPGVRAWLL
jgi:hypothetical protein